MSSDHPRIVDPMSTDVYQDNMRFCTGLAKHIKQLVREVLIEEGMIDGKEESKEEASEGEGH